jgi:hypothetical protein
MSTCQDFNTVFFLARAGGVHKPECLLLAQSGHSSALHQFPPSGAKRTSGGRSSNLGYVKTQKFEKHRELFSSD